MRSKGPQYGLFIITILPSSFGQSVCDESTARMVTQTFQALPKFGGISEGLRDLPNCNTDAT
jgi:hypothetical protein